VDPITIGADSDLMSNPVPFTDQHGARTQRAGAPAETVVWEGAVRIY
jgi:hypothetical protein